MGYPDWQTENTLAGLITAALQSAGIPLVSNPVLIYNILSPPPAGTPGPWGITAFGGGNSNETDINNWDATVGRTAQATRVYYQDNGTAEVYASTLDFDGALKAAYDLNLVAVVSYLPAFSGTTGPNNLPSPAQMQTDQNAMIASLNSFIAAGFPAANLRVVMHHEANLQTRGISPAQYMNLYSGPASGGLSHYQALHAICPVYSIMLGNQPPTSPQYNEYPPIIPNLPANACDCLMVDWYQKPYFHNQWLGGPLTGGGTTWDAMARAANVPLAIGEWGGLEQLTLAQAAQYLLSSSITIAGTTYPGDAQHSMQAVFDQRLIDGLVNGEMIAFWNYDAAPTFPTNMQKIVAALHDGLQVTAGPSIGPGATQTLKPIAPSPTAGYALAAGMAYDITINTISAAAGSTIPILTVTLSWFNTDDPSALPVATQKWSIPIGASGTTGATITGKGPQAGHYLQITVKNNDTVSAIYSVQVNSTGRTISRHEWHWEAPNSVAIPTYNLPGGDGNGLSLGALNGATVNAGTNKSWLFSLWEGQAGIHFRVAGAAGTNTVKFSLAPQPSGRWNSASVYAAYLPTGAASNQQELNDTAIIPRGPCVLTVTNNDAANVNVTVSIVALEQS